MLCALQLFLAPAALNVTEISQEEPVVNVPSQFDKSFELNNPVVSVSSGVKVTSVVLRFCTGIIQVTDCVPALVTTNSFLLTVLTELICAAIHGR